MDNTGMKLKRSLCGKMEIRMKEEKRKRLLISINIFGSAGAMRFVVNGDDDAAAVIDTALKMYAREGRLPVLGSDAHNFFLYPAHSEFEALSPQAKIGWGGARNFVLGATVDSSEGEPVASLAPQALFQPQDFIQLF